MPTYDYRCTVCGHKFEEFQLITDDPLTDCPKCGGKIERLIGAGAGLIFKGSGFYITDYRSDAYKKAAKADKPNDGSGSETKKESPPKPGKTKSTASS